MTNQPKQLESQHKILNLGTHDILNENDIYENQPEDLEVENKRLSSSFGTNNDTGSKVNLYLVQNEMSTQKVCEGTQTSHTDFKIASTLTNFSDQQAIEALDTVRSGESLIKHFNFDTTKYNSDTNKCVAFWRTIMYETDLQPVKCTLIRGCDKSSCTLQEEDLTSDQFMWYEALSELQKRKMDEVALAGASRNCKLCGQEEPYSKFKKKQSQTYTDAELKDDEDIVGLNRWKSKPRVKLVNASTDVQNVESLEAIAEEPKHSPKEQSKHSLTEGRNETEPEYTNLCKCIAKECLPLPKVDYEHIQKPEAEDLKTANKDEDMTAAALKEIINDSTIQDASLQRNTKSTEEILASTNYVKYCTCGEADCKCDTSENFQEATGACPICKTYCKCKEHEEELDRLFLEELKYELKQIRKDKSCETEPEEKKKPQEPEQFCIICGHNDCNCKGTQDKTLKYFNFIYFDDDILPPTPTESKKSIRLTEAQKMSRSPLQQKIYKHLGTDSCSETRDITSLTYYESGIAKQLVDKKKVCTASDQQIKTPNKNVIIIEPDKRRISRAAQFKGHVTERRPSPDDAASESVNDEKLQMAEPSASQFMQCYYPEAPPDQEILPGYGRKL